MGTKKLKLLYKKKLLPIILLSINILMFSGCSKIDENSNKIETEAITTVTEVYPVTVGSLIFNSSPETVISLSPALTEIMAELNLSNKLLGKSSYCDYPDNILKLNNYGSSANPDIGAIIETSPVLLISQSPIAKKDITALENANVRTLIFSAPTSLDDLYKLYSDVYTVFSGDKDDMKTVLLA